MDTKALQFESRFSLPPNSLGYCGKNTAAARFKQCILTDECKEVEEEVKHFIVLYPYLRLLSAITGLPELSYEVIEGYWLGNDMLKKTKPEHYDLLLEKFHDQGVPDFFVEELRQKIPKKFIPSHLFQVLHVGVGRASGAVPYNLESINNCMIRWGEVIEFKVQNAKCKVKLNSMEEMRGKYNLCTIEESIPFNRDITGDVKAGDVVAVHWNMVIKKLTIDEEKKLEYWTKKVIDTILI